MREPGDGDRGVDRDDGDHLVDARLLADRWVSAPEQGDGEEMVFVSGDRAADLPPARGRQSFVLSLDGSAGTLGPGADDRPTEDSGSWHLDGRHLSVRTPTVSHEVDIDRLEPGRLVGRARSVTSPDTDPGASTDPDATTDADPDPAVPRSEAT